MLEQEIEGQDELETDVVDTQDDVQHAEINSSDDHSEEDAPETAQNDKQEEVWPKKAVNTVSRLKKERAEIRAQRDALQREIENLKKMVEGHKESPEPTQDQFESYADWLEAKTLHKVENTFATKQNEQTNQRVAQLEQYREQLYIQERAENFDERLAELKTVAPDYAQVEAYAEPIVASFPENLKKAILAVDDAPKALYNLAKEGRLENLSYMPFEAAMAEIVQAQYRQPMAAQGGYQAQTPKKVTSAPKPLKTVSGTGKPSKQLHEMSGDEILNWVNS